MMFPAYPAYKDSEVEWLGAVPEHWSVLPVKWVGWLKGGAGFPHDKQGVDSHELDFHKVNALASADSDGVLRSSENTITRETAKELGAYIFPKETIVFAKVGAALLLGRLRTISAEACLDNNMMGLIVIPGKISNQFALYSMGTVRFDLIANPGAVPSLNEGQIGNYRLAIPGLPEQTQIACFLDHETARIDALIEKQQRLIELLKEKRQAVISQAVTKGLDPTLQMKDSGVEWLGEVPAHWSVSPLKFLVDEKVAGPYGASLTKAMYTDSGYRVYGQQQVISDDFSVGDYYISEDKFSEMQRYVVFPGDVLISVMGTIGRVSVVPFGVEAGIINPRLVRYKFSPSKVVPEFVKILLMSLRYQSRLREESQGSTMEGLNMVILGDLPLVLPPLDIQRSILAVVKDYDLGFDELVGQAESAVELLQERRSALISAAVTGKIDVRGWQPAASAQALVLEKEAV